MAPPLSVFQRRLDHGVAAMAAQACEKRTEQQCHTVRPHKQAMLTRNLAQMPLKGGARAALRGGSGQDVMEDWQATVEEICRVMQEGAADFQQQPPINMERHGWVQMPSNPAWQYITAMGRNMQEELLLFAERRLVAERSETEAEEPPAKKLRLAGLSPEAISEWRLTLCSLLDELRELQEDILEMLRDRSNDVSWSSTRALMRQFHIMQARLKSSRVYSAFESREPMLESEAPEQLNAGTRQEPEVQLAPGRKHLVQQVMSNTGSVCYINSIVRTWAWSMSGLEESDMIGQLTELFDLVVEGPVLLSLTKQPIFAAFASEWLEMHEQQDAGDFLGYLMTGVSLNMIWWATHQFFSLSHLSKAL